jgi:hypothetical protein
VRIHLASVGVPAEFSAVTYWKALAAQNRLRADEIVEDPHDAEVVLFPECNQLGSDWRLETIRKSAIAVKHREKIYVYDQRDRPWCAFRGIYVSMPASAFRPEHQRAWSYIPPPRFSADDLNSAASEADLLVSFVGSPTHPMRRRLFELRHPRGVFERVDGFLFHDSSSSRYSERRERFRNLLRRSKFVLCPRGHGTASLRLFETMAAGRVPVVISDDWVAPRGPCWETLSVRWPERGEPNTLLAHLEALEPSAGEMGARAREAFSAWFAESVTFGRVAEELEKLVTTPSLRGFPSQGIRDRQYRRLVAAHALASARNGARGFRTR